MISENDWKQVSQALQRMEEVTLARTLGQEEITVRTLLTPRAWPVAIIVRVQYKSLGMCWVKNCESVEEAKRCLTPTWTSGGRR